MLPTLFLPQAFGLYFAYLGSGLGLIFIFAWIYLWATPVNELALIRQGFLSPALSFGGALVGFSLTLASSAMHADTVQMFVLWGALAGLVQVLTFYAASRCIKEVNAGLNSDNVAIGALLGCVSIAVGVLNAGCLS